MHVVSTQFFTVIVQSTTNSASVHKFQMVFYSTVDFTNTISLSDITD